MKTLLQRGSEPNERIITEAVEALRDGRIIIYPTDTLYALGCDASNNKAVERLCRIKKINPDKNLLSIVCSDLSQAAAYARIDNRAYTTLRHYLPGPFTFILPASSALPKIFKGRRQAGIRIPDNAFAQRLAEELGNPLMSSSATVEVEPGEAITPEAVADAYAPYAEISLIIDAGETSSEPSTIVDLTDSTSPEIVRQGRATFED